MFRWTLFLLQFKLINFQDWREVYILYLVRYKILASNAHRYNRQVHPIIPIHIHIFVVVVLDISSPLSQCSHYKYNNKQLAGNNVGICSLRALTSQIYSFSVFYEFLIVIKTISGGEIDKLFGTNIKNLIKMFLFFCSSLDWCKKLRITIALCFTGKPQTCFYQTWSYSSSSSETKTGQETSVRLLICIGCSVP